MPRNLYLPVLFALTLVGCSKNGQPVATVSFAPAAFVGSESCQGCHEDEYKGWKGSHHELAMQHADAETILGDFDDVSFDYFGTKTEFYKRGDDFFVKTADETGQDREFQVLYTFGVEPLQQYLVEFPGGRLQTLAFSWDTRPKADGGQQWFHQYPDEYIAPDDSLHWTGLQQNWNYMCAECHSTDVDMGYDAASDTFDTTYSEISVGCEGCHGPGSAHIERVKAGNDGGNYGFDVNLDDHKNARWIMNMETGVAKRSEFRLQPQQQPEACGRCHARRGIIAPEYEYGKPLADTHIPALLEEGLYFDDGQILDEVYVYGSFLQSKMYQAGVTCTDCHNPHTSELVTGANPSDVCSQCHLPAKFAAPEHGGHTPAQAQCVDCHMTARNYMVVDDRRDHSFRIPRPDLSIDIDTPNACTACHTDQDATWAAAAVNDWRGPDAPALEPHFATALHASRGTFANEQLREIINNNQLPGIARATALSELAQPFGSGEFEALQKALGSPNALVRIAALRQLRALPPELRLRLPGARLLSDTVRGVRIEAAITYADMADALPPEAARAWPRAEDDFRTAYESLANRPEALIALATFETAEQNTDAAMALYERALQIEPRAVTARANLADAMRLRGEETQAESMLREGIALDADNAALRHTLGLSLVRSGRQQEALAELRRAAELAPDNARFAYVLGVALNSLGEPQEALQVLTAARERFSGEYSIAMGLATMLAENGQQEAALEIAYTLARRHPEDQRVLGLLRVLGAVP